MAKLLLALAFALYGAAAQAASTFTVQPTLAPDEKAVFATVESLDVVPARIRTGGTIASLSVKEGDWVAAGQVLALVGDQKLVLQQASLDAQIAGLEAQLVKAQADFDRAQALVKSGIVSKAQFEAASAALDMVASQLKSRSAERAVIEQQLAEGQVLAPTAGRVLKVPVTPGSVVMSGETVAVIAQQDFVLRLRVPERHARLLKAGDPIRLDGADIGQGAAGTGTIVLVYPQIQDGQVMADARVAGLSDYFVGERVQVWIGGGARRTFIVPGRFIATRFGLDYARLRQPDGATVDVPVQRGRERPSQDMPDAIEILSGLQPGDVLVEP